MPRISVKEGRRSRGNATAQAATGARVPQQVRSRERVSRILAACRKLIEESDTMSVTMTAVARQAGIPIGSLYQFFPAKTALIASLLQGRLEEDRALTRRRLAAAASPADYACAIREIHMQIYRENRRDKFLRDIWGGAQASRDTVDIHIRDKEFYARLWYASARRAGSPVRAATLRVRALAINEMWDGAIRLSITLSKARGDALMKESLAIGIRELGITR